MVTLLLRQSPLTILGLPVHTLSSAAAWQQRSGGSLDIYVRERKEGEGWERGCQTEEREDGGRGDGEGKREIGMEEVKSGREEKKGKG